MPIRETLGFEKDEYREVVSKASTQWLRQQEVAATRKRVLSGVSVGVGVSGAISTGGASFLLAGYKARSLYVAHEKLGLIRDELRRRNVDLHKFSKSKDFLGPAAIGVTAAVVGFEVTDYIDATTNIESLGAGLPDGASPSTGLFDDPSAVAHGAVDIVGQLTQNLVGDGGATAAVATTNAIATHAGMIQAESVIQELAQTATEKLLFSPGEPSPECKRNLGATILQCNSCASTIKQGPYWHCCDCCKDDYDICQSCYDKNVRCQNSRHQMKRLQTPTGPEFVDKISSERGKRLWKPTGSMAITRSELNGMFLFKCMSCEAEVYQGRVFHCFECGSFDLCDECYLLGKRCKGGHALVSGLCAIDTSVSPNFIRDCPGNKDSTTRACARCKQPARQGIYYHCCACEDKPRSHHYDICQTCYSSGLGCKKPDQHVLLRYLMTRGNYGIKYPPGCRRKDARSFKKSGTCTKCRSRVLSGYFFHCCQCRGNSSATDNFDLCLRCYRAGGHCLNIEHQLSRQFVD